MAKLIPVLFLFLLSLSVRAQTWEFGVAGGGAGYLGDLNPNNPVKISGIALSGFAQRNFNGYLGLRLNYTYGKIAAADSTSSSQQFRDRNLSFNTTLSELSLMGEFNFMSYIPDAGKNKYTPYLFLGIGALNYTPYATYNGRKYKLRDAQTEGELRPYPTIALAAIYGAGFKYNISGKLTMAAEVGYRQPNTDYLDDVSGKYANRGSLALYPGALADRSGEKTGIYIGTPGTQRGDLRPRDTYFFAQIKISYTLVPQRCYFQ
ncbi:DUF6089 family protein [Mucilaginibacter sp. L3T2-6]|uniref:type IX secretion system protein PorG n=1 Tax=Mucilaginibacter sp. L3T2-6 TaxID=3062491 RepID=UPI002674A18D|nr:DUF6089 family protein [Mucilaginibacter sp. L3T2-6]MDO3644537.1 DUF6089 family protein [Mucilaginibacter sp. L3T2-6]MDV6216989.1 DUF6089 family protein [Mucilaginibacter sp. L3T2-6]